MLTSTEAAARVATGAAYLDGRMPGWADRIDIGRLVLHLPCRCIVGQLVSKGVSGQFERSLQTIGLDGPAAITHGFNIDGRVDCEDDTALLFAAFRVLQDAWIAAIADRRLASMPMPAVEQLPIVLPEAAVA